MGCGGGYEFFEMGAHRPLRKDSGDARLRIENRICILRALVRIQPGRAGTWRQPRAVFGVQLKHAQDKSCGLAAVIQARIHRRGLLFCASAHCFT